MSCPKNTNEADQMLLDAIEAVRNSSITVEEWGERFAQARRQALITGTGFIVLGKAIRRE